MRTFLTLAVCLVASAATTLAAYASPPDPKPVLVSGPSPFAGCEGGALAAGDVSQPNSEVEPFVAVNPVDPNNLVGVYQRDRHRLSASKADVASYSRDGGATWHETAAAFSACAGGDAQYAQASDPWVTFDAAGNAYQTAVVFSADFTVSALLVSNSSDGGASWGRPKTIVKDDTSTTLAVDDKESITGDPTRPGNVYVTWTRIRATTPNMGTTAQLHAASLRGTPMFARTTDGGANWSTPIAMTDQNIDGTGNEIVVLPNGTLVDVSVIAAKGSGRQPSPNQDFIAAMTSTDAGLHWSAPINIARDNPVANIDPDTGTTAWIGAPLPSVAVDPRTGAVYAVWPDSSFSAGAHNDIMLSKSTGGGRTWSPPTRVNQTPLGVAAFNSSVAVTSTGTIAVAYYDMRNNTPDPTTLPMDVWLVASSDGARTWKSERHLDGPFDADLAPVCHGVFLGDYAGLAGVGTDVVAFLATADGATASNPSDIFSVRVTP